MRARAPRPPGPARRDHGLTLVEMLVAMTLLGLVATLGLRIVFLTDRAISRETGAATTAADALSFAAQLRDDVQLAETIIPAGSEGIQLKLISGASMVYAVFEQATCRFRTEAGSELGAEERTFPGITVSFKGSTESLVKAKITDSTGAAMTCAIHRRNAKSEAPAEPEWPY